MGNNPVGKKVNTPKGNYLGKYILRIPMLLKGSLNTFLLLALGFYVNLVPTQAGVPLRT